MPDQLSSLPTDGELLTRFARRQDEQAFAELATRHAALVYRVCRAVVGNGSDADDCAQAVFLTLARRAASLRNHPNIAGWLHRVSWHIANRALRAAAIRHKHELQAATMNSANLPMSDSAAVPASNLHEAIEALPEKYRLPLILHHFERRSHQEIATLLGMPVGTISARLTRGRDMLRTRLVAASVLPSSAVVAAALEAPMSAVPATFVPAMAKSAVALASGAVPAAAVSSQALALAQATVRWLLLAKLKVAATIAVSVLALGGAGGAAYVAFHGPSPVTGAPAPRTFYSPDSVAAGAPTTVPWVVVKGRVVGPDNGPIAGLKLAASVFLPVRASLAPRSIRLVTDAAGEFTVPAHPETIVRLTGVESRGGLFVAQVDGAAISVLSGPVLKASGQLPEPICIRLAPAEAKLTGLATDEQGKPVAGARITLVRRTPPGTGWSPRAGLARLHPGELEGSPFVATTGPDGRYELPVPPGEYSVWSKEGPAGSLLGGPTWLDPKSVYTSAAHAGQLDVRLSACAGLKLTVVQADGTPAVGARVRVFRADAPTLPREIVCDGKPTDAKGEWSSDSLPAGRAVWHITMPDDPLVYKPDVAKASAIDLELGRTVSAKVRLASPASLKVTAIDPGGKPLVGLAVAGKTTGPDGTAKWTGLSPGRIPLNPKFPQDPCIAIEGPADVLVGEGAEQVVELRTRRLPWRSVQGRVMDLRGKGIAGVRVTATPEVLVDSQRVNTVVSRTDADGRYVLPGLPPRAIAVTVTPPGNAPLILEQAPMASMADGYTRLLPPEAFERPFDLVLVPAAIVRLNFAPEVAALGDAGGFIYVSYSATWEKKLSQNGSFPMGIPKAGESVSVGRPMEFAGARPEDKPRALEKATIKLQSMPYGSLHPDPAVIEMEPKEAIQTIAISFRPGATIRGRVLDADAKPVPGAVVTPWAMNPDGSLAPYGLNNFAAITDEKGGYALVNIPSGDYALAPTVSDHRNLASADWPKVKAEAGKAIDNKDLQLRPGASVIARVLTADGKPSAGVLTIRKAGTVGQVMGAVDYNATELVPGRLSRLSPGQYAITAYAADAATGAMNHAKSSVVRVLLREGEVLKQDLRFGMTEQPLPPENPPDAI